MNADDKIKKNDITSLFILSNFAGAVKPARIILILCRNFNFPLYMICSFDYNELNYVNFAK